MAMDIDLKPEEWKCVKELILERSPRSEISSSEFDREDRAVGSAVSTTDNETLRALLRLTARTAFRAGAKSYKQRVDAIFVQLELKAYKIREDKVQNSPPLGTT